MSKKSRDFYHIQDQLPLAWRYASSSRRLNDSQLDVLSLQIDNLAKTFDKQSRARELIELWQAKISLLERTTKEAERNEKHASKISDEKKQKVEVSLSSSGMGFFSKSFAEDDAKVEISLKLNTVDLSVDFNATVFGVQTLCRL